ncbi:MAG: phosphodiesterase [Bacteroidaceae bacterium]|nr:phosphodiesterase [Bacteroidaceae bacterium]
MRYLIVSDIHGSLPDLEKVIKHFNDKKCDMLCILGDILNYGPRNGVPEGLNAPGIVDLLNSMADKIIAVRGNCDSEVDQMLLKFPMMADYALLVDQGKRIFLTHGHVYNEANLPNMAVDAFFYGHTHLQKLAKTSDGKIVCNTGSITFPKGGNPKTFAIYENGKVTMCKL